MKGIDSRYVTNVMMMLMPAEFWKLLIHSHSLYPVVDETNDADGDDD